MDGDTASQGDGPVLPSARRLCHPENAMRTLVGLVALVLASACGGDDRAVTPWRDANLVIVSLDTVRRGHLSCYGYSRATTPHLAALAAESAVFETAVASCTQTAPAHASIFTGLAPASHGITRNGVALAPGVTTLAQRLHDRGYRTGGFVSGWTLARDTGLGRGFDEWDDHFDPDQGARRDGAETLRRAIIWLGEAVAGRRPFLLFVHFFEAHWPYDPPARTALGFLPERTSLRTFANPRHIPRLLADNHLTESDLEEYGARYDGELVTLDGLVDELRRRLEALGIAGSTVLVVLADHGETLFERPWMMDHGARAYDEQIRIPLLIRFPDRRWAGRRETAQVSHLDLLPTLLEAVGADPAGDLPGRSLLPLLAAPTRWEPRPVFSGATCMPRRYPQLTAPLEPDSQVHAVRLPHLKLIEYPRRDGGWEPELFDLAADPGETRNLAARRPADLARLHRLLDGWRRAADGPGEARRLTDPDTRRALEELGYLE